MRRIESIPETITINELAGQLKPLRAANIEEIAAVLINFTWTEFTYVDHITAHAATLHKALQGARFDVVMLELAHLLAAAHLELFFADEGADLCAIGSVRTALRANGTAKDYTAKASNARDEISRIGEVLGVRMWREDVARDGVIDLALDEQKPVRVPSATVAAQVEVLNPASLATAPAAVSHWRGAAAAILAVLFSLGCAGVHETWKVFCAMLLLSIFGGFVWKLAESHARSASTIAAESTTAK